MQFFPFNMPSEVQPGLLTGSVLASSESILELARSHRGHPCKPPRSLSCTGCEEIVKMAVY